MKTCAVAVACLRVFQHQIHVVPAVVAWRQIPNLQVNSEIAVAVGYGPLIGTAEPGAHCSVGDRAADDPASYIAQMGGQIVLATAVVGVGLTEHPPDQEDFFPRSIAAIGLKDDAAPAMGRTHRPGGQIENAGRRSLPFPEGAARAHGTPHLFGSVPSSSFNA